MSLLFYHSFCYFQRNVINKNNHCPLSWVGWFAGFKIFRRDNRSSLLELETEIKYYLVDSQSIGTYGILWKFALQKLWIITSNTTVGFDFFVCIDFLLLIFRTTHTRNLRSWESLLKDRNTWFMVEKCLDFTKTPILKMHRGPST